MKATLAQNDTEVLERFQKAVGMGQIYRKGEDAWQWQLGRYLDVVEFCFRLAPRVGSMKRRQMLSALDAYVSARYDA